MKLAQKTRSKYAAPGCHATWMGPFRAAPTSIRHACHWHDKDTKECICPCGARHLAGQNELRLDEQIEKEVDGEPPHTREECNGGCEVHLTTLPQREPAKSTMHAHGTFIFCDPKRCGTLSTANEQNALGHAVDIALKLT